MEGETMSSVLASVSAHKEKAAKAMAALHSHRNLITSCISDWEELHRSFGITERSLQQKFKELAEQEKEYDIKMQETRAALEKREKSIAGLEETSLARVKEQKDTAISAIVEERKKFDKEQIKWKTEKQVATQGTTGSMVQGKEIEKATIEAAGHSPLKDTQRKGQKQGEEVSKNKRKAAMPDDEAVTKRQK